jgi:hypothetical protein
MSDQFLSKFSKLPKTTQPVSTTAQYSNTLPESQCPGGFPVDNYAGNGVNAWEVMYSTWISYQSTIGAQFTQSQADSVAPTSAENTMFGPKNIFIIRHGEKTSSSRYDVEYHLNQNGAYRACQLPNLINDLATNGYPITYLVSANPCPWNSADASMRQQQTITMASFLLNIPMFMFGSANDNQAVVDALFEPATTNPFNGLNVMICWEHTAIQDLCLKIIETSYELASPNQRSTMGPDEFFAQPSVSDQTCVGGKYVAPPGEEYTPFNVKVENPTPPPEYDYISHNPATSFYPYWNTHNYDNMFCFFAIDNNNNFDFVLTNQQYFNCLTCYPSCELKIGLYQPINNCTHSVYYYDENDEIEPKCLPPTGWEAP